MFWLYFVILSYLAWHDLRTKRIPDSGNAVVLLLGVVHLISMARYETWIYVRSALATLLVFLLLLGLAIVSNGGLGGGDIKLATGLTVPVAGIGIDELILAWYVITLTTIPLAILLLFRKIAWKSEIPFGPCLAVGYLVGLM